MYIFNSIKIEKVEGKMYSKPYDALWEVYWLLHEYEPINIIGSLNF